ncbi:RHS repeat-associated core domain-containing protein [Archangium violaceum]|uniref:RHS repeat-associated core domain-containing protein n=1 Tax=Archangium violaceum TaxID=83451 RepID=UPI002B2BDC84|nr:RHS repeat-associated core domain-containing protein [Archangium gephyra]
MIQTGVSAEPSGPLVICKYPDPEEEICDGVDNDCDGVTDNGCPGGGGGGADGGTPGDGGTSCGQEICDDEKDNDCDGETDEEDCSEHEPDGGSDGGTFCEQEICYDEKDNDCDGETDEDCLPYEPDGGGPVPCVGPKCMCSTLAIGDPVNIASGTSFERIEDTRVADGINTLTFERTFSSRGDEWIYDAPLAGVPKPFGASPKNPESVEWWHNWLSVVVEHQYYWSVRDGNGQLLRFNPCSGSLPCEAAPAEGNISRKERLKRTSTGYELMLEGGTRHVFEALFVPAGGERNRYFLSRILSPGGVVLANLTYTQPALTGCVQGGTGSSPGVPYLSSVETQAGGALGISYRALTRTNGGVECVIGKITRGTKTSAGVGDLYDAVTYTYTSKGGVERPGRIDLARYRSRLERYLYPMGEFQRTNLDVQMVRHTYGSDGRVSTAVGGGYGASISWEPLVGSCQPGSNCCGRVPQVRQVTDVYAGRGDGNEGSANLTTYYETLSNYGQELQPRLYQTTEACSPSWACSPGSDRSEWTCSSPGNPGQEVARKDKRNNWEVYLYSSAGATPQLERTQVLRGASDMTGTGALEQEFFSYTYSNGQQLLQLREEPSVLGGASDRKRTSYVYESGTNRTKAVFESGMTRERASNGTWTTVHRIVGTFYFTASGTSSDPMGRLREVHGPCLVSSETAMDCTTTDYPVTKYEYYGNNDTDVLRRNRLKFVRAYPSRTSTAPLETEYVRYNESGTPTEIMAPNGVTTRFTYEEDRPLTIGVGWPSVTTEFKYADKRNLSSIMYPEGNYEVFCYRVGTPTAACSGGTLTEKLQWKARAGLPDGTRWTEKVVYAYWPDGTLKEERYLSWTGTSSQTRRVLKYAVDAHRRPTWNKQGEGAGSFHSVRSFDGADNLTGVGLPFNEPPAWCGGVKAGMGALEDGTPLSQLCSSMAYDRANRLVRVDEFPTDGVAQRTLFNYDAQGNVSGVKMGCNDTNTFDSCGQPAATYTYDDFGHVVEMSLPHAVGPVRYAYDARGNMVLKETEAMRQALEYVSYTYDMLSRQESAVHVSGTLQETLYRFGYDSQGTYPTSCPALTFTMGNIRYREDSFGKTWYQYDKSGRVVGEIRVRAGQTACSSVANANPHTFYTYTANGNLASVTYPNGRTVTFVYGTGAAGDRVTAVDVTIHNGTAWTSQRLLSNVSWEPYGGLRGYTLTHPTSSTTSTVEYALGDDGSVAPVGCSAAFPSAAGSDLTGRLRGLRVSSGTVAMGAGTGDVYRRTYTWKADQVVRTDTCLLDEATPRTETYGYDRTLRLVGAGRPVGNFAATGGAFDSRSYGYDGRGNRTSMRRDGSAYSLSYAATPGGERLTDWGLSNTSSLLGYSLGYDKDGRVVSKEGARTLDGTPMYVVNFAYGQSVGVATDTVFRAVEVNGAFYNYYYDALGRRRLKSYPGGTSDEFFHDVGNQLLVDRGNNSPVTPVAYYTQDDYVWLDGRPVVMVRGKLSTTWSRLSDSSEECARNGEAAACGVYFPITDHIGKPVLVLDSAGLVAGAAEHDVFGMANRVALHAETQHPLPTQGSDYTMAELKQPTSASTQVRMRVLFHLLDTNGNGDVTLRDGTDGTQLTSAIEGSDQGYFWSGWVQPSEGYAKVDFSYATPCEDCSTGGAFAKAQAAFSLSTQADGVVLEAYEYQRYQTGAQPFFTPLRFPGQYHDTETDLFENWNRYYDPSIGRYLQPEPLLEDPRFSVQFAQKGYGVLPYAYAGNNAIRYTDPTGREMVIDDVIMLPVTIPALLITWAVCEATKTCPWHLPKVEQCEETVQQTARVCPPCPSPPPPRVDKVPPSRPHFPCPGDHMHTFTYRQNPQTCQCFLGKDQVVCLP